MTYLSGTSDVCLKFRRNGDTLTGYVDSDYVSDLYRRRSLSGYIFTLGGCLVSWKASLQHIVALSTTETEYMAITKVVKELFG